MPQEHQNKSKLIKIKTKINRKLNLLNTYLIEGDGYETVNIKGVNKGAKIYAVRSTPMYHLFFFRQYTNNDLGNLNVFTGYFLSTE